MHRKIGEFLHDICAIDAIKITEPFFCDASYNQIGKLGTLMVHVQGRIQGGGLWGLKTPPWLQVMNN